MSLFHSNRVIAMDIGASQLKLAEFSGNKSSWEVLNIAVRPLGVDPGNELEATPVIVETIQTIMREKRIRPAPVMLSVTGQSAFMRLVHLPPVKRGRIYQTVRYEAQQVVPFPIDEVIWDYQFMGSSASELNVMVVAIKKEIIENLTDCVEAADLEVELVDVAPMSLYNAVRYNYSELKGCILVIDIGARSTNLVFMEEGRFWSRNLPIVGAGNTITQQLMKEFELPFKDAEALKCTHARVAFGGAYEDFSDKVVSRVSKAVRSAMTRLHVEVERTINFYRSQQEGNKPDYVFLAGGTAAIARTDEFFKEKLKVEVEYLNPFKNIFVNEAIAAEEVGACAHMMGEVVGAGLRQALPCPLEVNLLPPKIAAEKTFRRKQPFLLGAAVTLILIVLCWWFYFFSMAQKLAQRQGRVQEQVNKLETMEKRIEPLERRQQQVLAKARELAAVAQDRTRWLAVLDSIHACLPDGMWLVALAPQVRAAPAAEGRGGRGRRGGEAAAGPEKSGAPRFTHIEIRGLIFADKANDRSIAQFRDQLRLSPLFTEETEIELAPLPTTQDIFAREFTILIALKNPL